MSNNYVCVPNKFIDELNGMGGNGFVVSLAFMYRSYSEDWQGQTIFKHLKDIVELIGIKRTTIINATIEDLKAREVITTGRKEGLSRTREGNLYYATIKYAMYFQADNEGYFKYPIDVLGSTELNPTEKMVYGYILRLFGSRENKDIYPSIKTMASALSVSDSTIKRSVSNLKRMGYLAVKPIKVSKGHGEIKTKNYYKPRYVIREDELTHLDESVIVSSKVLRYKENPEQLPEGASEDIKIEEIF
jgi:DNA-binding transcriptional regulator YhcF (GntR family)